MDKLGSNGSSAGCAIHFQLHHKKISFKNLLLKLNKNAKALPDDLFEYDHFETLEIISENLESIDSGIQRCSLKNIYNMVLDRFAVLEF